MTNDGYNTLVYDAENHTVSATNGSASGTYTYDGNGFRIKKVSASTTTVYIFSGSKVIAEYVNGAAPSSPTREYLYSGATLLAKVESGATNYYHQDHLSNRLVTNSSGTVTNQMGHFPFGESWYTTTADKLLFTSYERDSESGNDYAIARYYISRLARFGTVDPLAGTILDPQSLNHYSYALNNPIGLVDPSGAKCVTTDAGDIADDGTAPPCDQNPEIWKPEKEEFHYDDMPDFWINGKPGWYATTDWLAGPPTPHPYYTVAEWDDMHGGNSSGLNGAINQARLMLSNPDCASFLKGVLTNLGYAPNLDSFLKEFDHLTIIPTPGGDAKSDPGYPGPGYTAHIAFGFGNSSTVHVDAPRAADLVPTLLHETFHDTLYGVGDPRLAAAATGVPSNATLSQRAASRVASREFDKHCTPK